MYVHDGFWYIIATMQLYDRRYHEISLDEVELILWGNLTAL
jgi:hypothetical protein